MDKKIKKMRLSVIGLGKLGSCAAACLAVKGFSVIGVDINRKLVEGINSGKTPVIEPKLKEFIDLAGDRLKATIDYGEAIQNSEITFLIVPTPIKKNGSYSDKFLQDALRQLALKLKETTKEYHVFVIVSTVSPGTTEKNIVPLIASLSGRKYKKDFGVCYNPEFVALGNVINDFLNPDIVLIGESDERAGDQLVSIYEKVCENSPYIARMSVVSAEITKISLNSYITTKISFANTLGNICENIPGANIDDITKAMGADKRISPYYFKAGISYGGPCFPRDNKAFSAFAQKYGIQAHIAKATDETNRFQVKRLVEKIFSLVNDNGFKAVSILGLSYKPNTPVIEESPGVKVIEELLCEKDIEIIAYDPLAMEDAIVHFGENILFVSTIEDCFSNSSLCIITTPEDEFRLINENHIVHDPTTIVDCWRILDPLKLGKKVNYIPIGKMAP